MLVAAICCFLLLFATLCCYLLQLAAFCPMFAAVCCCWLLFPASFCHCLLLFCLVCFCLLRLLQLYLKNCPKITPRALKMVPKGAQMPPQIDPKWPLGAPQGPQEAQNPLCCFKGSFFIQFWTPKRTPKSTENLLFGEKSCCHVSLAMCFQPSKFCIGFLLKFGSIFGRPNPWKYWFCLGKTTIFKEPLFFKKCPNESPKWPQNLLKNSQKWSNKHQTWRKNSSFERSKNILKKTPQKAPK